MPLTHTPLRYPGGKSRLRNFFQLLLHANGLKGAAYIEPFAGGAGLALGLLRSEYVSRVVLNDVDPAVHAFWHTTLRHPETLCAMIDRACLTIDEWERQRRLYRELKDPRSVKLGFAALYMNRTNRSGILAGGPIGGKRQTGKWKLNARFNKQTLIRRVRGVAEYRNRIRLEHREARSLLADIVPELEGPSLIYLDPPYYRKGRGLYENHYGHNDHEALARQVRSWSSVNWVVSYDNFPEVARMYAGFRKLRYGIGYSAASYRHGRELMVFARRLRVPDFDSPLDVDRRTLARHLRRLAGAPRKRRSRFHEV